MSYPNLDQICAAIKADDARYLYSLSLATRSRYQTVETRLADLNQRIVDTLARAFRGPLGRLLPSPCCFVPQMPCGLDCADQPLRHRGISVLQPVNTVMRFEALGQPGAPWIVRRSPEMSNANACLMVSSILSEPVLARQSAEEQLSC